MEREFKKVKAPHHRFINHGKWILEEKAPDWLRDRELRSVLTADYSYYICSECGKKPDYFCGGYEYDIYELPNFCPNCGSRNEVNE